MDFPFELQRGREFDVAGFGTNAVDFLIRVPRYPEFDSKIELEDYSQLAGGEIATAMAGLQRLGLKTCYVGRFGTDAAGDSGVRPLVDEGVDVSLAERVPGATTQIAFIVIDVATGEPTVIWKRDPRLSYSAEEAPLQIVQRASVLHCTPHDTQACIAIATEAKRSRTIVSIDLDNIFPGVEELLPMVDVLITSAELPGRMLGIEDTQGALIAMHQKYGSAVVGVTLGETGSLVYCGGKFVRTPGFHVPGGCKDTTGAGDSFRAGLLYGLVRGESIEESARIANAVAALKCRAVGARTSLPTPGELTTMLKIQ